MSSHCSYLPHPPGPQRKSVALSMWPQREPSSSLISMVSALTIERGKARYQRNPLAILESRESHMNHHYFCMSPCPRGHRAGSSAGDPAEVVGTQDVSAPLLAAGGLKRMSSSLQAGWATFPGLMLSCSSADSAFAQREGPTPHSSDALRHCCPTLGAGYPS